MNAKFWRIMTTPLEELTIEELEFCANHTDNSVTSRNIFLAEIARRTDNDALHCYS